MLSFSVPLSQGIDLDDDSFDDDSFPMISSPSSSGIPSDLPSVILSQAPSEAPSDSPLPTLNCLVFQLTLVTDQYGGETFWELTNDDGNQITSGASYPDLSTETYVVSECLSEGDYTFTIYDWGSDGICCGYGSGSYELALGNTVLKSGGIFDDSETVSFSVPLSQENN